MKITSKNKDKLSRVGLKAFFRIASFWELNSEQQIVLLGIESNSKLIVWNRAVQEGETVSMTNDQFERLSLIVGIRKGVELLYPKERVNSVMKEPNKAFSNKSMIDVMLSGSTESLYRVRRYLDSSRGAHFL